MTGNKGQKGPMLMKKQQGWILGGVLFASAVALIGCTRKSETDTPPPGVVERTGAALDTAAEKTVDAAKATGAAAKDVTGVVLEKSGQAVDKTGEALEETGERMREANANPEE